MSLLYRIDKCLRAAQLTPTRFGRNSVGDPRLVFDLKRGRELRPKTAARVERYIASLETDMTK